MKSDKIYILSSGLLENKVLKIGITNNIEKRLKSIKTGNPEKVELIFIEEIPSYVNIREMENWLHSVFGKNRLEGEWFSNLTKKEIRKKIFNFLIK